MRLFGPTSYRRFNEAAGIVYLALAVGLALALVSYRPTDPSANTATSAQPANWLGQWGAWVADLLIQSLGVAAGLLPVVALVLGWSWLRSRPVPNPLLKLAGLLLAFCCGTAALALSGWELFDQVPAGGVAGVVIAGYLVSHLNVVGAVWAIATGLILACYLCFSSFSIWSAPSLFRRARSLVSGRARLVVRWPGSRKAQEQVSRASTEKRRASERPGGVAEPAGHMAHEAEEQPSGAESSPEPEPAIIPIWSHEEANEGSTTRTEEPGRENDSWPGTVPAPARELPPAPREYQLPSPSLLNPPGEKAGYDEQELNEIAVAIKKKLEEFNVFGSVVQINHGPVVTTFEFKPDAGIKYSRITSLRDDLCLGLQAESILIERIPGKSTVGIEVPNSRREIISLREILESTEFRKTKSKLPIPLGKDIRGRIRIEPLEMMPHLLIAGSTGSGKSVMLNATLVSILYKSTPDEVRMVLIDPKRVELNVYEGLPHLLTPVVTDARQASVVLRNAVLEMEHRLKLLAAWRARNLEEFNAKVLARAEDPSRDEDEEIPAPLPYILILIDELSDLMIVERANVESAIIRLAQMARAVGMHLMVATQRPSVDVITGLIKNNFPARISFRVATRADSRTILDTMGAEHLLGRGDMLFLPPGSARLVRVHGPLVTEAEITRVVDHWKSQAAPEYDDSFLKAPDEEDTDLSEGGAASDDPLYADAVRVVVEVGKASTSILQRRLRLGYGRAARLLDAMEKEGIIGPPTGSRPREVLRVPEWLKETVG